MADPELDAMAAVNTALEALEAPARGRVLAWAAARFDVPAAAPTSTPGGAVNGNSDDGGQTPQFGEVGDLVHAAQPSNGPEHALVVGYWLQEIQGRDGWTGAEINSTLKNMGAGLANVTKTLDSLKGKKPALVMQVSKSGRSMQARKTYKLTTAGVREVRDMIAKISERAS